MMTLKSSERAGSIRRRLPGALKRAAVKTVIFTILALMLMTVLAYAGDPGGAKTGTIKDVIATKVGAPTLAETAQDLGHVKIGVNMFFVIVGVALIFFMQAGFALVETGFCRAKNAAHVIMTNFVIFAVGIIAYWAVGFAVQFGGIGALATLGGAQPLTGVFEIVKGWGLFGTQGFLLGGKAYDVGIFAFWLFQLVFMDTAATIVTGIMAERWKFSAFVVYGFVMAALIYPVYGMWVWGGGWLSALGRNIGLGHGVVDFAGSSVVHAVGGIAGFAGAIVLGPRLGKYSKDGKANAIPGHHIPMAVLGTIFLVFGWMGFNGMSTLSANDLRFSVIITNTMIAAAMGCLVAMFIVWKKWGKPDPSMSANGMLAGLVAITAPCAFVNPIGAAIIGGVAGVIVVYAVIFVDQYLHVDDPVGAVSVHGVCGLWGLLSVGIFADGTYGAGFNGVATTVRGALYGDPGQLVAQAIGVVVVCAWAFGTAYAFFKVQDAVQGIRVTEEEEIGGLDLAEMGVMAYPDFANGSYGGSMATGETPVPRPAATPERSPVLASDAVRIRTGETGAEVL